MHLYQCKEHGGYNEYLSIYNKVGTKKNCEKAKWADGKTENNIERKLDYDLINKYTVMSEHFKFPDFEQKEISINMVFKM